MKTVFMLAVMLFSMNSFALFKCATSNDKVFYLGKDAGESAFYLRHEGERAKRPIEFKFGMTTRHILSEDLKMTFALATGLGTAKIDGEFVHVECLKNKQ